MKMKLYFVSAGLLLVSFGTKGQPGMLDSTFSQDGLASVSFAGATAVVIQTDGKIVVGGGVANGSMYAVARFNSDGSPDNSFSGDGESSSTVGTGGTSLPSRMTIQSDGKLLQAGSTIDNMGKWCFGLLRWNTNGSLDNSFNGTGKVIISFNNMGEPDYGGGVAVQPDGKIVVVGQARDNSGQEYFGVARLNSDGTLDNSFSSDGKVLTSIGNSYPGANSVAIQLDGKILVGGSSSTGLNSPICFALARYNSDGSLDNSFGVSGKDTAYFGNGGVGDFDRGLDMVLQPDGKILMTGYSFLGGVDSVPLVPILRYKPNGTLDSTFGINGKIRHGLPCSIVSICMQQDGKILLAGSGGGISGGFAIVRLLSDASIDTTFGESGIVINPTDSPAISAADIEMQADGKIVVAGDGSNINGLVARYLSGLEVGIIDFTQDERPILVYPNPIASEAVLRYDLTQNENLTIELLDLQGRIVQSFITNERRTAGKHEEVLHLNEMLAAGNYVLSIGNGVNSQGVKVVKE